MRGFALLPVLSIACAPPAGGLAASADTTTSTGPDMSSGTGEPPMCPGSLETLDVGIRFDGQEPLGHSSPVQLDSTCVARTIDSPADDVGLIGLALDCGPDPADQHYLEIRLDRPLRAAPVVLEQRARLRVQIRGDGDDSIFLALHDSDGELAFAYANTSALPGDHAFPPADFFAPLTLAPAWPCPVECPGFDGLFVIAECFCVRRGALEFSHDGSSARVDDHAVGELPGPLRYDLRVFELRAIERETCEALAPGDSGVTLRFLAARLR